MGSSINIASLQLYALVMPLCCNPVTGNCVELTEREYSVCHLICVRADPVSFTELRRTFDYHQEILSRILRRLTIHNVIEKTNDGMYVATRKVSL